ncbi:MAG: glycerol-3-phosphate responsive antiterminator [Clostridia bacterium]|nr:glycerol-3-phosphate responsive antiterminator [Clostridia bacterium]
MSRVIAAVRSFSQLKSALSSNVSTVFCLAPNINTLREAAELTHNRGKKIFIHIDMAEGLGKDKYGIKFAKDAGIDGIISTRANMIKAAKSIGLSTVQRFFIIDAQSVHTAVETSLSTKPDMIEVMPGIATKVIKEIKKNIDISIIAGGLIETEEEAAAAELGGADAISTSCETLWNI